MKKKILFAFFVMIIASVLFAITSSAATVLRTWDISATSRDNVTATLYNDYSLVISGTGNMKDWNYNGAPWYSSYSDKITSVTIENGVTNIGSNAFRYCSTLTSVVIPDSVTSIGGWAFAYCYDLTSVVIPEGVTSIAYYAFQSCSSLTSIVISKGVTSIGYNAFYNCSSLSKVYYGGTAEEWAEISIGYDNYKLTGATRYYYSESEPTEEGNFWHYDDDGNIAIW